MAKTPEKKTPDGAVDPTQEALFREIDEDLRHEQMTQMWKRYGNFIIGGAVAIVAIVAGYQGWQAWKGGLRTEESSAFVAAKTVADGGDLDKARQAMTDLAQNGKTGYATLAALYGAGLDADQGKGPEAAALYRNIARDSGNPAEVRDLATLLAVLADFETGDPGALEGELAALTSETSAWRFVVRELSAHLALKAGDRARAADLLSGLTKGQNIPAGVQSRAKEAIEVWGLAPAAPTDAPASN